MRRKDDRPGDPGRDYATLLGMGWTPDTPAEAVGIARDLLSSGDGDGALSAVESARSMLGTDSRAEERAAVEAVAFEVALTRADSSRAINSANALRAVPSGLPHGELSRLREELTRSSVFRVELKEALERVLDAVIAAAGPDDFNGGEAGLFSFEPGAEEDLPYLDADPAMLEFGAEARIRAEEAPGGIEAELPPDVSWLDLTAGSAVNADWTPGSFVVQDGEDLHALRARFLESAAAAGPDYCLEACETGWSFFLMEDYGAAVLLFDPALGDPATRVSAAEGAVRSRLHMSQAADAVAFLERLQSLCYGEGLPEALRYWYGRAAEMAGDVRKARAAYRSVPADAFDVRSRLGALP
jgi:hypothetical protein